MTDPTVVDGGGFLRSIGSSGEWTGSLGERVLQLKPEPGGGPGLAKYR